MYDVSMNKNQAAQTLGKLGGTARAKALSDSELSEIGKQGGKARAAKLTADQRSEIARKAVQARIAKHGQQTRKGDKA
jgi:general stress protein YciG